MSKLRLDKLLSHMGYGSRKEVRQLIKNGSITVNDILCRQPETVVDTQNDRVAVGQTLLSDDEQTRWLSQRQYRLPCSNGNGSFARAL